MAHVTTLGLGVAAGAAAFAGILQLIVWCRQRDQRTHLWFGLFCLMFSLGVLEAIGAYHADSVAEAIRHVRHRQSALCLGAVFFLGFLVSFTRVFHKRIVITLWLLIVFFLLVNVNAPFSIHYASADGLRDVTLPWGERITKIDGSRHPLLLPMVATGLIGRAYIGVLAFLLFRRGARVRGSILLVCVCADFLFACVAYAISAFDLDFIFLGEFSVFFWIFAVSVYFSEEFRERTFALEAANRDLQVGEERFRTLVQNIPGVVYRCATEPPWRMEHISEGVEALAGYRVSEFMGEGRLDWNDLIVPEDVQYVARLVEEAISQREPYVLEYRIRDAQGAVRWVHERGRAIFDSDKNALLLDGIILDVSDQRALEQALEFVAQGAWTQGQDTFFSSLVSYLADNMDVDCAIVGQLSADGTTVEAIASTGFPDDERIVTCRLEGTPSEQVIGKRPRYYPADLCGLFPQDPWLAVMRAKAYVGVPLWDSDNRPLGVLSILSSCPIERPPLAISILQAVAPRVAAELEQKQAEERILRRVREIAGLSSLGRRINSTLAVREVAEIALEDLFKVSTPDIAFFCEWHDDRLRPVASHSDCERYDDEEWLNRGAALCQFAAKNQRPVFWACPYSAPQGAIELCDQMGIVSFGALPLIRNQELLGILALVSTEEERNFGKQIAFLEAFCNTVAIGLHNAQLFEEASKIRETLQDRNSELEVEIAERCRVEEALRESEQVIRALVETSREWIWSTDVVGNTTFSNPAVERILGYEPVELLGKPVFEFLHSDDRAKVEILYRQWCTAKQGWANETLRWRHKDGSWRWLESSSVPILNANDVLIGFRGVDRDITDRIQAGEKLSEMEAQLTHAGRLSVLGEMVAGIAHEINQPLYSIVNFSKACRNMLRRGGEPNRNELAEWNDEIAEAASRATEIIKRLRQFARKGTSHFVSVHIDEVIEDSVELMAFELRRKGVEVFRDLASGLPAVSADRVQIEQVLINLLQNACEAMAEVPKASRQVFVRTRHREACVVISIEDRGPGLREENRFTIFHPFVTTKADGLGMGLAISTTIAEAHGGKLWATSGSEGGAAFHLLLPCM
jgi:PAS domain S-box-containing protein